MKKDGACRRHDCDIHLGDGQWLRWIELPVDAADDVAVDSRMVGLERLWAALETYCVRECCGIDAFDLSPRAIVAAVPDAHKPELLRVLTAASESVATIPPGIVLCSAELNQRFHRDLFPQLLAHLSACLERGATPPG